MRTGWTSGLVACIALTACGSGASSLFGGGDGGADVVVVGMDTGTLGSKDSGGHKDSSTPILKQPDSGLGNKDAACATAITCASVGAKCGTISNGCGGVEQCGVCPTNQTCGGGGTANVCGSMCTPTTCAALGFTCGTAGDGCGGMLSCGTCEAGTCGGGGVASQCGSNSVCTPTTCAALGDTCGTQGDGCGGSLNCGTCGAGQTCGGGGTPNACGAPPCVPSTCASLGFTCGPASDGCGNELQCGTCSAPKACGGGTQPGVCGCTGTCAELPTCPGTTTTTITGKVYDPADIHPLYNVLVYVPNNPSDPALTSPFPEGVTCDQCGATAAGDPLVTTQTAPDGSFTLSGVPVSASLPLVIQLGRWRRQFTIDVTTSCGLNPVTTTSTTPDHWLVTTAPFPALAASGHLTMPTSSSVGDIPRISILTGGWDPMECVLRKMGIAPSEFTDPGGAGHINFYTAASPNLPPDPFTVQPNKCPPNPYGSGAIIDGATPAQAALFSGTTINNYDVVILACEGYEEDEQPNWAALGTYTSAGGRVLMSDFAYDWMAATVTCTSNANCPAGDTCSQGVCLGVNNVTENPAYTGVATWDTLSSMTAIDGTTETSTIDLVSNPVGTDFQSWLQDIGVVAAGADTMSLDPVFQASNAIIAPTQQWLHWGTANPIQFTFNTPIGAAPTNQCGRANFMDWHADNLNFPPKAGYPQCPYTWTGGAPYYSHGMTFPAECDNNPMTPQEAVVEFMLFDVSSCVTPYQATCNSLSCAQQGFTCGPAGDGCGNLIQCGTCMAPDTCGGGGVSSVCGAPTCNATTCAAQGIQCGPAGDGCGNSLNCGTCPAGQTCGGGGKPGICGAGTCTPSTCAAQNIACGPAGDGCGNALNCGNCPAGESCGGGGKPGQCGSSCTPETCAKLGFNCGAAGNGCGAEIQCGTCTGGQTCGGGGTPGVCGTGGGPK